MEEKHERLNKQFSELEKEWAAMKTGKSSSAISCTSTIEEALEFVENSPRKLMISLQYDQACPEAEMRSPCRRKLFHDSDDNDDDDETKMTMLSHSTCWSSNVIRVGDTNNKEKKKKRGMIVCVSVFVILIMSMFLAVVVIDGFDDHRQINTLVPT